MNRNSKRNDSEKCRRIQISWFGYQVYDEPNTGDSEINQRIQLSQSKFAEMLNLLQNFSINLRTRVMFLNSVVCSR